MAGHIYIGVEEQVAATYFYYVFLGLEVGAQLLVAEFDQVGQGCFVGIPVAAAVVFELGNLELNLGYSRGQGQAQAQEKHETGVAVYDSTGHHDLKIVKKM